MKYHLRVGTLITDASRAVFARFYERAESAKLQYPGRTQTDGIRRFGWELRSHGGGSRSLNLHRMIKHRAGEMERIHLRKLSAEPFYRVAHNGKVDKVGDDWNAGKIL